MRRQIQNARSLLQTEFFPPVVTSFNYGMKCLKEMIESCIHGRILLPEVYFMIDFELTQKYMEILGRSAQFEEFAN